MGFLSTEASLLADMVFITIIAGFLMLLSGVISARKQRFRGHVKMANSAVLIGTLSVLWMFFAFISIHLPGISSSSTDVLIVSHVIVGTGALFTGMLFSLNEITKTRTTMRIVFFFWIAATFLGIWVYSNLYLT